MFELYQKLSLLTTPSNFTALQAARTINNITDEQIKETILLLIFHHYTLNNGQKLYTETGINKFNLPYNGQSYGMKSTNFNFEQLPLDLQQIIINYLWECSV